MPELYPAGTRIRVGRIPFHATTMDLAVEDLISAATKREPIAFRLSNAYCVALASRDSDYARIMSTGGVNFPDGTPVVWIMRLHDRNRRSQRVRGPSFFRKGLAAASEANVSNFFLGTTDSTLDLLTKRLTAQHNGLSIAGSYSPPFAPVDEGFLQECCARILESEAQLIWVALGTPKQDFVATQITQRTGLPTAAVGAAFDFEAGTAEEAPAWMQNSGFEWLHRLASEPKRLWRRYLLGNIRFIYSAVRESEK